MAGKLRGNRAGGVWAQAKQAHRRPIRERGGRLRSIGQRESDQRFDLSRRIHCLDALAKRECPVHARKLKIEVFGQRVRLFLRELRTGNIVASLRLPAAFRQAGDGSLHPLPMVAGSLARAEPLNHFEHQVTLAVDVGAILQAMVVTLRLRLLALVADPRERDQRQRRAVDVFRLVLAASQHTGEGARGLAQIIKDREPHELAQLLRAFAPVCLGTDEPDGPGAVEWRWHRRRVVFGFRVVEALQPLIVM